MNESLVRYRVDHGVAVITMDDPEHRNALNLTMRRGLRDAFDRFNTDPACQVGILTASGSQVFCAGGGPKEMAEHQTGVPERTFVPILNRNLWIDKPIIAAVNGIAFGGGFLLAMMCDFAMPEAKWSRGAPWSIPLHSMISQRVWMELALTGEYLELVYAVRTLGKITWGDHIIPLAMKEKGSRWIRHLPLQI